MVTFHGLKDYIEPWVRSLTLSFPCLLRGKGREREKESNIIEFVRKEKKENGCHHCHVTDFLSDYTFPLFAHLGRLYLS